MTVLICGDRKWGGADAIEKMDDFICHLPPDTIIIEGEAKGADLMARQIAEYYKLLVIPVPALWDLHGKSAGPIRNREMLDYKPDRVVGFHSAIWTSKGTLDCLREADARGIHVKLIQ